MATSITTEGGNGSGSSIHTLFRKHEKPTNFSKLKSTLFRWSTDFWGLELLSWVAAVVLLLTAIALLASRDNRVLPQWYLGITLNTVLSIFSGLFQWCLMMPVIECIGQLKWLWFIQPKRRLSEFTAFEDASSNPWGPFSLLKVSRVTHLVSIGAVITLIAPTFPTLIQQALSYELRPKPSGNAVISRCTGFFEVDGLEDNFNITYATNPMKSGIYNGLYNSDISLSNITASCPTGNCTWPIHSSLAICASIADLTPLVVSSCSSSNSSCTYSLPSGGVLAEKNEYMSLIPADGDKFTSIAFPHSVPILDVFTFLISSKTNASVLLESSLNLCVQSYNISSSHSEIETTLLDSWHTLNTTESLVIEVPGQNTTFEMGDSSYNTIADFLRTIFNGTYVIDNGNITYGSDAIEVLVDTLLVAPWDEAAMSIFLEGMATSMTNTLRTGSWSNKVNGTSYSLVTYVRVQWLWMIPPALFVFLTLIFLLATMVRSNRQSTKLWKTSSLATLYGLHGPLEAASMMEENAEKLFVQLKQEGQGWRLAEYM